MCFNLCWTRIRTFGLENVGQKSWPRFQHHHLSISSFVCVRDTHKANLRERVWSNRCVKHSTQLFKILLTESIIRKFQAFLHIHDVHLFQQSDTNFHATNSWTMELLSKKELLTCHIISPFIEKLDCVVKHPLSWFDGKLFDMTVTPFTKKLHSWTNLIII